MRLIRLTADYIGEIIAGKIGTNRPQLESCALALGSFDGLHRGHQELIHGVRASRDRLGLEAGALFTFMQHPRQLLDPRAEPFLLTTWRAKLALLQELECQVIVAADFCPELSRLGYEEFVEKFLVGYLGMKHLVAGYDTHLGSDRRGTAATLEELGAKLGYTVEVIPPVKAREQIISSSAIRRALAAGDLSLASAMLGRPYAIWGEVTPGDRRGREIGFPTANIQPLEAMKLLPETGVYAARVQVPGDVVAPGTPGVLERVTESLPEVDLQGDILSAAPSDWAIFGGMLNFGHVPTFHGEGLVAPRVEANMFGFEGDLRGRNVKVEWIEKLRPERKFGGADELIAQLNKDQEQARRVLGLD
ncbi:MAG: bifunctional riboflavin kinase/FMN adenylyltransferase [Candidatus Krumholzibacteriota bacterium]